MDAVGDLLYYTWSCIFDIVSIVFFFFQAEDGIRDKLVTGVQTCALPIWTNSTPCVNPTARTITCRAGCGIENVALRSPIHSYACAAIGVRESPCAAESSIRTDRKSVV